MERDPTELTGVLHRRPSTEGGPSRFSHSFFDIIENPVCDSESDVRQLVSLVGTILVSLMCFRT